MTDKQRFGLLGRTLSHSHSPALFAERFKREGLDNASYSLFELDEIEKFPQWLSQLQESKGNLSGLNVTVPYKESILPYLSSLTKEAKAIGADVILLIAACLSKEELKNYGKLAEDLGMDVLYEVHNQQELDKIELDNKIIGINNRNLKTFKVDLEHSIELASQIPDSCIKVSESGLNDPRVITGLKEYGFQGFLIGENFMKTENPGQACKEFIDQIG